VTSRPRSTALVSPRRPAPAPVHGANQNLLLAALPDGEYVQLQPSLELVVVGVKELLLKAGEPITSVYFPGGGFCSDLAVMEDGRMVEVATIGREGMIGFDAVLGGGPASSTVMVQALMESCYRMPAAAFQHQMDRRGPFCELITHYGHALVCVLKQLTACNAVHSVEQRLARWLLMAQDRVGKSEFPLTQEFVAMMLGASRPTITLVAGTLQKAGLITYRRGLVSIARRQALEGVSCECYRTATRLMRGIVSASTPHPR